MRYRKPIITIDFESPGPDYRRGGIGWYGKGAKALRDSCDELPHDQPCLLADFKIRAASLFDGRFLYLLVEPAALKSKPTDLETILKGTQSMAKKAVNRGAPNRDEPNRGKPNRGEPNRTGAKKAAKKSANRKSDVERMKRHQELSAEVERKHSGWLRQLDLTVGFALERLHKIEADLKAYSGMTVGQLDVEGECLQPDTEKYLDSQGEYSKDDEIDDFISSIREDIAQLEELIQLHGSDELVISHVFDASKVFDDLGPDIPMIKGEPKRQPEKLPYMPD